MSLKPRQLILTLIGLAVMGVAGWTWFESHGTHLVAGEDADEVHPYPSGGVRHHLMPVGQLDPEHDVGQGLLDGTLNLYGRLLWHWTSHSRLSAGYRLSPFRDVRTSTPASVTIMVCSK